MNYKQKLYKNIMKDVSSIIKQYLNENIINNEKCPISLDDIPIDELEKKYVDFLTIIMPPNFGDPLFDTSKNRRINENIEISLDIDKVQKSISKKYNLADWQFTIYPGENNIEVALIIPHINMNEQLVIDDMVSMGYYENNRWQINKNNMVYTVLKFDPRYPMNITNDVRNMHCILHLTPKYNWESIKENGFIPQHRNERFTYPPRLHFLKGNINMSEIMGIGQQLSDANTNRKNTGEYVLLILDVNKIPKNVKFIGDSCYAHGVCTEDYIPYNAVISEHEIKFNK